jgi:hypothetical protein
METPESNAATIEDIRDAEVAHDQKPAAAAVETSPAEQQGHHQLFQHSRFVHVGPGAETCEDVDEEKFISNCGNPLHFHVWIRTPNQFQHNSIREKALAAKARKLRALRDLESDARTVLDGELEELRHQGGAEELLIQEIVAKDGVKNYWQATREVQEEEEFAHYEEDRNRLNALAAMADDDRPQEEYEQLGNHIAKYGDRVREVIDDIERPLREALAEKDLDTLIDLVTEDRIQAEAAQEFEDTYSLWEWYIGTSELFKREQPGHPDQRKFTDIEKLKAAPAEVISALAEAFTELDAEAGRALGNS